MLAPAIRWVATTKSKAQAGSIQLLCHIKPGVSAKREGISAVSDETVELCVAAQAREGEANKAVRDLIADVLKIPKSDVEIAKGLKSRQKTVAIYTAFHGTPHDEIERIKVRLRESASFE